MFQINMGFLCVFAFLHFCICKECDVSTTKERVGRWQYTKKGFPFRGILFFCGAYGTRTRDPMRDRHVF